MNRIPTPAIDDDSEGDKSDAITPAEQAIIDQMERDAIQAVRTRVYQRQWLECQ